jgi:hypothetical protein
VKPSYTLYSASQVAWASLLGAPLAGCVLLGINYARLGKSGPRWITILRGIVGTIAFLALAVFLPDRSLFLVVPIACTFNMFLIARSLQGALVERHLERGGRKASTWAASGIGIVCLAGLVIAFFGVLFVLPAELLPK